MERASIVLPADGLGSILDYLPTLPDVISAAAVSKDWLSAALSCAERRPPDATTLSIEETYSLQFQSRTKFEQCLAFAHDRDTSFRQRFDGQGGRMRQIRLKPSLDSDAWDRAVGLLRGFNNLEALDVRFSHDYPYRVCIEEKKQEHHGMSLQIVRSLGDPHFAAKLTRLRIRFDCSNPNCAQALLLLQSLEHLDLIFLTLSDQAVQNVSRVITGLSNLRSLSVRDNVSDHETRANKFSVHSPTLESLMICSKYDLIVSMNTPKLKIFYGSWFLSPSRLSIAKNTCQSLERLHLTNYQFSRQEANLLSLKCPKLKVLHLIMKEENVEAISPLVFDFPNLIYFYGLQIPINATIVCPLLRIASFQVVFTHADIRFHLNCKRFLKQMIAEGSSLEAVYADVENIRVNEVPNKFLWLRTAHGSNDGIWFDDSLGSRCSHHRPKNECSEENRVGPYIWRCNELFSSLSMFEAAKKRTLEHVMSDMDELLSWTAPDGFESIRYFG